MVDRMEDLHFRQQQLRDRYCPHIKPINQYVDRLRSNKALLPYVAPIHGGVAAGVLSVMYYPGNGYSGARVAVS